SRQVRAHGRGDLGGRFAAHRAQPTRSIDGGIQCPAADHRVRTGEHTLPIPEFDNAGGAVGFVDERMCPPAHRRTGLGEHRGVADAHLRPRRHQVRQQNLPRGLVDQQSARQHEQPASAGPCAGVADRIEPPVATIMVGEKGYATVRLSVTELGGHSSMPGKQTAVGRIARAVARIQDHPMPLRMTPVTADMLARVRKVMPAPRRQLLRLADLVAPMVTRVMAVRPQTEALVRTTTAPTVIRGGVKSNVLPQHAEAFVNFRILPGDTVASVLAHCQKVVRDNGVRIETEGVCSEPTVNATPGAAFDLVAAIAHAIVPGTVITTGIVPGATDSRHYHDLAATRCNFAPIVLEERDLASIHGTDERLSRVNYARLIEFNRRLFTELAYSTSSEPHPSGADA
ncbi:peptidase dimerization domain-containing protein, partial [Streptomyces lydicus]